MSAALSADHKNWLVKEAEGILDEVQSRPEFKKQTAQLRNMVQITQTEVEIAVLSNFIRYQVGRDATKKFWTLIYERLLKALDKIGSDFPEAKLRQLALQSFFGYMVRHYVYLTGGR